MFSKLEAVYWLSSDSMVSRRTQKVADLSEYFREV